LHSVTGVQTCALPISAKLAAYPVVRLRSLEEVERWLGSVPRG